MKYFLLLIAIALYQDAATPQVSRTYEQYVAVGMIGDFGGPTCPTGWLRTNGAAVLDSKYPKLNAYLQNFHGDGSAAPAGVASDEGCPHASNCFNLPDTRGRFSRDVDEGAGRDTDAATRTAPIAGAQTGDNVGSVQADQLKTHTHNYSRPVPHYGFGGSGYAADDDTNWTNTATSAFGGSETRPKNNNFLRCIKY